MATDIVVLHSALAVSAGIVNGALLISLLLRTPASLKSFAILMRIQIVADLCNVLACFGTMNRVIPTASNIIHIYYGPCTLVSPQLCYALHGLFLVSNSTTFHTTIASFLARWYILKNGGVLTSARVWMLAAVIIPPPGVIIALCLAFAELPVDDARAIFQQTAPEENITGLVITGNVDFTHPAMILVCFVVFILVTPMYLVIWVLRSRILRELARAKDSMSEHSRLMHHQFVKVLTLQALAPSMMLFGMSAYVLQQLRVVPKSIFLESFMILLAELPALLNPLIVFAYIPVFRSIATRLLCPSIPVALMQLRNSKVSTSTSGISAAAPIASNL